MNLFKNPIFWGLVLFLGGIVIGGWGWDKNESTIPGRTVGAIPMIVAGVAMIIAGLVVWFAYGSKTRK